MDSIVKKGFVASSLLDPLIFSAVNNPNNYSKSWNEPKSELVPIANEIIDVNLVFGMGLAEIKIEASF